MVFINGVLVILDTMKEIVVVINNDLKFSIIINNVLVLKASLLSSVFIGTLIVFIVV